MWIVLIIMGTFMRGPGWYLFLPGQYWDAHKTVAITNRDLPAIFGITGFYPAMAFGGTCVAIWMVAIPAVYWQVRHKTSAVLAQLGSVRYWITAFFFMTMTGTCVKVALRLVFAVKYVMVGPHNFNI